MTEKSMPNNTSAINQSNYFLIVICLHLARAYFSEIKHLSHFYDFYLPISSPILVLKYCSEVKTNVTMVTNPIIIFFKKLTFSNVPQNKDKATMKIPRLTRTCPNPVFQLLRHNCRNLIGCLVRYQLPIYQLHADSPRLYHFKTV